MHSKINIIKHDNEKKEWRIRVKTFIFKFFFYINDTRHISKYLGVMLLLISFLQVASLIQFHLAEEPIDEFQTNFNIISVIINHPIYFIEKNKISNETKNDFELIIYIYAIMLLVLTIISGILVINNKRERNIIYSITMYLYIFTQWVAVIPFICLLQQSLFESISATMIIHIILILFFVLISFALFYFNILSTIKAMDFFNANSNVLLVDFYIMSIVLIVINVIINKAKFYLFFGFIFVILFLIKMLIDTMNAFMFYGENFFTFYFTFLIFLIERTVIAIINKYTLKKYNTLYQTYFTSDAVSVIVAYFLIKVIFLKKIKTYALMSVSLLQNRNNFSSKNAIMILSSLSSVINDDLIKNAIIADHIATCSNEHCPLLSSSSLYIPKHNMTSSNNVNDNVRYLHMVKELYVQYSIEYRYDFKFRLSYILFILFNFGNFELALTEIESVKQSITISFADEFILFILKELANERVIQQSESTSLSWGLSSIINVINYDKLSFEIKSEIYQSLEKKRALWSLFENDDIIVEEICEKGEAFFNAKSSLSSLWRYINKISKEDTDKEITKLYCDFLSKICDDTVESEFIMEREVVQLSRTNDEIDNNKYKSDTGVVIIESNCSLNPGKITYINSFLVKALGYQFKTELIGNNIKTIIPGDIGRYHDDIIRNYFEKGKSEMLKTTQNHLCMKSKDKYLLPIHLLISILPSLGKSMEGIGIIRLRAKPDEVIFTNEQGLIEASTKLISQLLNITPNLIEKNSYYIQSFFVELMKPNKEDGIPFFFKNTFDDKKSEYKLDISCPKQNSIDTSLYKTRTRNVFLLQAANNHLSSIIIPQKLQGSNNKIVNYTAYDNLIDKLKKVSHGNNNISDQIQHSPLRRSKQRKESSGTSLANYFKNLKYFKSPSASTYKNFLDNEKNNEQRSPTLKEIILYKKECLNNIQLPDNIRKIAEKIYASMHISHELHSLTEKCECNVSINSLRIYNKKIEMKIVSIPFNNLFAYKKENSFFSDISEGELAVEKAKLLKRLPSADDHNNAMYEIGSVAGKDMNVVLQKHLKMLKTMKYDSNLFHKVAGTLMTFTVITATIVIIIAKYIIGNSSVKYFDVIMLSHRINNCILDLGKYAQLVYIIEKVNISNSTNVIWYKEQLIYNAKEILNIMNSISSAISKVFSLAKYSDMISRQAPLDVSLINKKEKISFLNSIYLIVDNSLSLSKSSLLSVRTNVIPIMNVLMHLISSLFEVEFDNKIKMYHNVEIISVVIVGALIVAFLTVLFMSYRTKKRNQLRVLTAFEEITNEEVEKILIKIDSFERRYIDVFKNLDEYNKKKITFNQKNSKIINQRNQRRMEQIQKEEMKKKSYNILNKSVKKSEEEKEEKIKKKLILRDNMTMKYITSFFFVLTFLIVYILFFLIATNVTYKKSKIAKQLAHSIYTSKYLMNYEIFTLDSILFSNFHVVASTDEIESNFDSLVNITFFNFQIFTINVIHNKSLFSSNITNIINSDICSQIPLTLCNDTNFTFVLQKGFRSIVSSYSSIIKEAFLYYKNNYDNIKDIDNVMMNTLFLSARKIISNMYTVYDEIFFQLIHSYSKDNDKWMITMTCVGTVLCLLFFIAVAMRLNAFIALIKSEEVLCNQLIAEIPNEILSENNELKMILAGSLIKGK